MLREFEPALRLTRSCAERAPKLFACSLLRAIAAKELGLEDEARAAARRLLEIYPKFTIRRLCASSPGTMLMPPASPNTSAAPACRSDPQLSLIAPAWVVNCSSRSAV
jgi:hypothetical protein